MSVQWVRVAAPGDVADNSAVRVEVGATAICVARSNGTLYAVGDRCTHADISLAEGEVEDGTVECWLHGSRFNLTTGEPTGLPATTSVPTYSIKTEGDDVLVAVEG